MPKCKISEVVPLGSKYESPILGKDQYFFLFIYAKLILDYSFLYLAHFQNGSISPNFAADLDCYLAKDETMNDARVAIAVSKDNVYSSAVSPGLLRNFIGILSKTTNKVQYCYI